MAALAPVLVSVLQAVKRVFDRPRYGLSTYDFDADDRMFLRGSGSFKFTADVRRPRSGLVRIVGSPRQYKVEVFADSLETPLRKSFSRTYLLRTKVDGAKSPKVRKFAAYACSKLAQHFHQMTVDEVHDL